MLSCLLGCASSNNSGVEVPRPSVRGAAAPVGVQLQPPALLRLRPRANPAVHPLCRPEGCAEEEDEAGKRTHLSLSLSLFAASASYRRHTFWFETRPLFYDQLLGKSVQTGPNNSGLSLFVMPLV
jgi:hypothetical protein